MMLEIDGVGLRFGGVVALADVSLQVDEGESVAVIGPNGAGKTSLLNCISGAYHPTSGHIRFRGKDITRLGPDHIARLGIRRTFQNLRIFSRLSTLENLLIGAHGRAEGRLWHVLLRTEHFRRSEAELVGEAEEILRFLGLEGLEHTPAGVLPYGLQKRLEIARALMGRPQLLLLDEPAAGLSTFERHDLTEVIRAIWKRGLAVILIEHDIEMVSRLAERVVVLDNGRRIAEGTPDAVRRDPKVVAAYLGEAADAGA